MFSGRINGLLSKQNMFQKRFHGDLIRAYAVQYFVNSWMMDWRTSLLNLQMTPRWEKEDGGGQIAVWQDQSSAVKNWRRGVTKLLQFNKGSHSIRQEEFNAEQQTTRPTAALQEKEQCFSTSQTKEEEKIIMKIVKSQAVEWDEHPATHLLEPGCTKPPLSVPTVEHLWSRWSWTTWKGHKGNGNLEMGTTTEVRE